MIFIREQFGYSIMSAVAKRYAIGTCRYWEGATVFWQIDNDGKIRTGKIMLYDPKTGHRVKNPTDFSNIKPVSAFLGISSCF